MTAIYCDRCQDICRTRKAPPKRVGDILELAEIIYHKDGTKTRRVYGHVNVLTQQIVDMSVL